MDAVSTGSFSDHLILRLPLCETGKDICPSVPMPMPTGRPAAAGEAQIPHLIHCSPRERGTCSTGNGAGSHSPAQGLAADTASTAQGMAGLLFARLSISIHSWLALPCPSGPCSSSSAGVWHRCLLPCSIACPRSGALRLSPGWCRRGDVQWTHCAGRVRAPHARILPYRLRAPCPAASGHKAALSAPARGEGGSIPTP